MWTSSTSQVLDSLVSASTAVALPGVAPCRRDTSTPTKDSSVSAGEPEEEATKVASPPASALGGVAAASLRTSSAVLVCSICLDAQLPAVRQGALRTGAAGLFEPLDVPAVEGVSGAGGVNPVTLIASGRKAKANE